MAWQTFEHTADVGLRIEAASLAQLFEEAARALASLWVDDPRWAEDAEAAVADAVARGGEPVEERFALASGEHAELLFDWLHALLVAFEVRRALLPLVHVEVASDEAGLTLRATARGVRVDPALQPLAREVKAITYHRLALRREGARWTAEVVVDV